MGRKIRANRADVSKATAAMLLVVSVGLFLFTRAVPEAFDLPKSVLVVLSAPILLILRLMQSQRLEYARQDRWFLLGLAILITGLIFSAIRNPSSQLAWIGQEHRYTGVVFWVSALVFSMVAYSAIERKRIDYFNRAIVGGSIPFLFYGVLQMHRWDPLEWNTETFAGTYIFATQGNPNFASWTTALSFGCAVGLFFGKPRSKWGSAGLVVAFASLVISVRTVSIQGLVGISLLLGVWVSVLFFQSLKSGEWSRTLSVIVFGVCLAAIYVFRTSSSIWLIALIGASICSFLTQKELRVRPRIAASGLAVGLGSLMVLAIINVSKIQDWILEQSGERRAFYRAAFGMIGDQPLFGHGFDRYGRLFTRYRPTWHAEQLPNSISGSAHSVWFGLLVSGGVMLTAPFLLAVVFAVRTTWRWASSRDWDSEGLGFFGLVLVLPVLWIVSVEQASVVVITLVVIGLALGLERDGLRSVRKPLTRWSTISLSVVLLLFATTFSYRWLAGNKAQGDAYRELFGAGNLEVGLNLLDKAVAWGPQASEVRAVRANIYLQLGERDIAVGDAIWVAREYEYSGYGSLESAEILMNYAEFGKAIEVLERTIANNANNKALVDRANELLVVARNSRG